MTFSKILLISILIIGFFSCGDDSLQEEKPILLSHLTSVDHSLLILNPSNSIVSYQDSPFTGISLEYKDSTLVESITYLQGKKDRLRKKWFPDGPISYEAHYNKGKLNGFSKTWWKNGNLRSESFFVEGKLEGIQKQWYKSGAKFKELNMMNGKEEGMQRAWRENGAIYNNYEAKNGRVFGLKKASLCFELDDEKVQYAN